MLKQIAKEVTARMKELGLSYRTASKGSGLSVLIIQKIRHEKNYTINSLIKLYEYLGLTLHTKKVKL